jgi:hypothetical protein
MIDTHIINEWWANLHCSYKIDITGFKMSDYSPENGFKAFHQACDDWWDSLSFDEKKTIWRFRDKLAK